MYRNFCKNHKTFTHYHDDEYTLYKTSLTDYSTSGIYMKTLKENKT